MERKRPCILINAIISLIFAFYVTIEVLNSSCELNGKFILWLITLWIYPIRAIIAFINNEYDEDVLKAILSMFLFTDILCVILIFVITPYTLGFKFDASYNDIELFAIFREPLKILYSIQLFLNLLAIEGAISLIPDKNKQLSGDYTSKKEAPDKAPEFDIPCPSCGKALTESMAFCKHCGTKLNEDMFLPHATIKEKEKQVVYTQKVTQAATALSNEDVWNCPKCGRRNKSAVCWNCGLDIHTAQDSINSAQQ